MYNYLAMEARYHMDITKRQITKIAREVSRFTSEQMKETGVGSGEFDVIHYIRHNPGATQAQVRDALHADKGATAKRVASLEEKGYLIRNPNPDDGRSQLLYATEKADALKNSKANIEAEFYTWLLEELPESERQAFCQTLEKLYQRAKQQRQDGFPDMNRRMEANT